MSYLIIPNYLSKDIKQFNKIIINSLNFICIYGLYQFIAHYLNIGLPYGLDTSMISYGIFRIRSIFREPSLFLFPVMMYLYLIVSGEKLSKKNHIIIISAFILSFSLTIYGLLFMGIFTVIAMKKLKLKYKSLVYVSIVIFSIVLYFSVPLVQNHIRNLIVLHPSSSTTRLVGGIIFALKTPYYGVGIGNLENYYNIKMNNVIIKLFTTGGAVNNIIAVIKIVSGYLGLFVFIWYLIKKYSKVCKDYLIILFVSFFTWGNFNSAGSFFFLIMLEILRINRKEKIKYEKCIGKCNNC
ncbi:hypothetical protein [Tepiditoga spiralis]|nr:hypothetical protein [Tepiditoga spiralis]